MSSSRVTEFELLRAHCSDAGGGSSPRTLLRKVWRCREGDGTDRVRTAVKKLPGKTRRPTRPNATYIFNEHGASAAASRGSIQPAEENRSA